MIITCQRFGSSAIHDSSLCAKRYRASLHEKSEWGMQIFPECNECEMGLRYYNIHKDELPEYIPMKKGDDIPDYTKSAKRTRRGQSPYTFHYDARIGGL